MPSNYIMLFRTISTKKLRIGQYLYIL